MKKHLLIAALALVGLWGCKEESKTTTPTNNNNNNNSFAGTVLSGNIGFNDTLRASTKYKLQGFVYVKPGVTLVVEPGTVIFGDKSSKGTLIVERGAKLIADGTASQPIVFTSGEAKGSRSYGDWGGIIICGKAPVNLPGGEGLLEGGTGALFGGTNPTDNSGTLRYVRIEFGGIAFQPNNEINGLTLGGVGSGTTIENIQVSYSGDDAYEWFGGTVNAKNLVSFRNWDDDFDTDNGFIGMVQFGVVVRDPAIADQSGSNGIESDNDGQGTDATPFTAPVFSNISIFGPLKETTTVADANYRRAAHIRRNSRKSVYNSLLAGYPVGLLVDGSKCEANATANSLAIRKTLLAGCTQNFATASGSTWDATAWFNTSGNGNQVLADYSSLGIVGSFNSATLSFLPTAGSALLSGADFTATPLTNSFFTPVTHLGAFGTTDWTTGWTNFNPQNTDY
jgi:hypothetical protein